MLEEATVQHSLVRNGTKTACDGGVTGLAPRSQRRRSHALGEHECGTERTNFGIRLGLRVWKFTGSVDHVCRHAEVRLDRLRRRDEHLEPVLCIRGAGSLQCVVHPAAHRAKARRRLQALRGRGLTWLAWRRLRHEEHSIGSPCQICMNAGSTTPPCLP